MLGSLNASCNTAQFQRASGQAKKTQQVVQVRCSASKHDAGDKWTAKQASLPCSLLAAAASLAVSLTPAPAVASVMAAPAPQEVAQIAQAKSLLPDDKTFQPEKSIPGDSTAQEAAARANPPPFDPVVIGGTAGILLLAFGFSTGRADPQLKMANGKGSSGGKGAAGGKVAEVKERKNQARAWIGDWQKRTKKSS